MKRIFAIVVFFSVAMFSYAQSSTKAEVITHKFSLGKICSGTDYGDYINIYSTSEGDWWLRYAGHWVNLSKGGTLAKAYNNAPDIELTVDFPWEDGSQWHYGNGIQKRKYKRY